MFGTFAISFNILYIIINPISFLYVCFSSQAPVSFLLHCYILSSFVLSILLHSFVLFQDLICLLYDMGLILHIQILIVISVGTSMSALCGQLLMFLLIKPTHLFAFVTVCVRVSRFLALSTGAKTCLFNV